MTRSASKSQALHGPDFDFLCASAAKNLVKSISGALSNQSFNQQSVLCVTANTHISRSIPRSKLALLLLSEVAEGLHLILHRGIVIQENHKSVLLEYLVPACLLIGVAEGVAIGPMLNARTVQPGGSSR